MTCWIIWRKLRLHSVNTIIERACVYVCVWGRLNSLHNRLNALKCEVFTEISAAEAESNPDLVERYLLAGQRERERASYINTPPYLNTKLCELIHQSTLSPWRINKVTSNLGDWLLIFPSVNVKPPSHCDAAGKQHFLFTPASPLRLRIASTTSRILFVHHTTNNWFRKCTLSLLDITSVFNREKILQ